jgi:peptidoglycan/LPS O-acetylase OafA/YrhL
VSAYDFAGLVGGLSGAWLLLLALLAALAAALRLALVRRRPGKGRLARGVLAGASLVGALGVALFWAAELLPFRRQVDRAAPDIAIAVLAAGVVAGWRAARRRPEPSPAAAEPSGPGAAEPR